MDLPSFAPQNITPDRISLFFMKITRGLLIVAIGLLPIFFIPGLTVLTGVLKVYMMLGVVLLTLVTFSLGVLRRGSISLSFPQPLIAWWGVVLAAIIAALMSPQIQVAFFGTQIEIHTVGFLVFGGLLMAMMSVFKEAKSSVVYLYSGLFISAFIVSVLHIARLVFGPEILSFGLLTSPAATLVGSFNDLALFLTMVVILGMISLLQLNFPKAIEVTLITIIALSLMMLGVINFFTVWIVLGLFGLLLLMYALTKGRIGNASNSKQPSISITVLSLVVFITSLIFIIGGPTLGGFISQKTGVSYLEVRPSFTATLDILKDTYKENALTGSGPNHFNEAWTKYKDPSLNQTLFWNTPFVAGNGYITTWFVTGGLLLVFAWFTFLVILLIQGVRTLLRNTTTDPFWYFIATISFTASIFIWGMSLVYVPGSVILMLGFVSTGLFLVASEALSLKPVKTINLLTNTRTGFVLITVVMIVIISSVGVGYKAFRQLLGLSTYASALTIPAGPNQASEVTLAIAKAYAFNQNDVFVRDLAVYQLQTMRILASNPNLDATGKQQLNALVSAALDASSAAINERGSDARNWAIRGDVYTILATGKAEGAYDKAMADYKEARLRDPQNPYFDLQIAILELSKENQEGARLALAESLKKKSNYTDALTLLSQLDIASGNIDEAIKTTESLISLEATNPGRYYQLGVLYSAKGNHEMAISAFSQAVALNPQYANALYLRAVELLSVDNKVDALKDLSTVRDLNPDNAVVSDLIDKIERNEITAETIKNGLGDTSVSEPTPNTTPDGEVTTVESVPDTDLVTPVNTAPKSASSTEEGE